MKKKTGLILVIIGAVLCVTGVVLLILAYGKWNQANKLLTADGSAETRVTAEAETQPAEENGESSLCRLFLPTESELFGDCHYSEDDTYSQIEYYKDRRNRIKCNRKGGSPDWYWTASVRSGYSAYCVHVNNHGHSDHWLASSELYVPVCFVIQ